VKSSRAESVMALQQEISLGLNEQKIGKTLKVLIDRREEGYFVGRSQYDSPEVDNEVLIPDMQELSTGEFYQVRITGAQEFDLFAEVI